MSAPWEKYASQSDDSAPWDKYAKKSSAYTAPPEFGTVSQADQIPGVKKVAPAPEPSLYDKAQGAGEAAMGMLGGAATQSIAIPYGVGKDIVQRMRGVTPTGVSNAEQYGSEIPNPLEPKTPLGREYMEKAGNALGVLPPVLGVPGISMAPRIAARVGDLTAKAPGAVARGLGTAAQEGAGLTTGAGGESLRLAYKAGKESDPVFVSNMRGEVPIEHVLQDAKTGLSNMQQTMHNQYRNAKTGWAADKAQLDFSPIEKTFDSLDKTLTEKGHRLVGDQEENVIGKVRDVLDEWKADPSVHTTLGLDALKRRLDAIYPDNYSQKQAQRIISGTRNAVKDAIVKQAPDYAEAMKDYETRIGAIHDIEQSLSLGNKVAKDTAIRKLQSLMRSNVSTNYGYRQGQAENLEKQGGVNITSALAGQNLNAIAPRGLARGAASIEGALGLTHPAALAALPLSSPRLMGEAFYGAGKVAGKLGSTYDAAVERLTGKASRAAVLKAQRDVFQEKAKQAERDRLSPRILAPDDPGAYPVPQARPPQPPQTRGLLSADKAPLTQRNSGVPDTERLATRHEGVPTVDFALRQEVLQWPEYSEVIDAYKAEAEHLRAVAKNAISPKVRRKAQLDLDKLSDGFAAGMKEFGISTAEDAHGLLRPLYEGGKGKTSLPIKKTLDFSKPPQGQQP